MTTDESFDDSSGTATTPNPALRQLDRLVGAWEVADETIHGRVEFAWMAGGFFMTQTVELRHEDRPTVGIEYIGFDPETETLASHYFGNEERPLRYTWEVEGDTLTIWHGPAGSPAFFRGTFSPDGASLNGAWTWPGGGYASSMTRIPDDPKADEATTDLRP